MSPSAQVRSGHDTMFSEALGSFASFYSFVRLL